MIASRGGWLRRRAFPGLPASGGTPFLSPRGGACVGPLVVRLLLSVVLIADTRPHGEKKRQCFVRVRTPLPLSPRPLGSPNASEDGRPDGLIRERVVCSVRAPPGELPGCRHMCRPAVERAKGAV